jgi:surfeit locus 1 family protein
VRREVATASAFALAGFVVLCGFGVWQLERLGWKERLMADLEARLSAPPQALPVSPEQGRDEFRRVRVGVTFTPGEQALVYTPGSALRPDVSGVGYWVLSPARTERGTVIVNRGFVPVEARGNVAAAPLGEIELTGALRWPEEGGAFLPRDEPANNVWYRRDPAAIAAAKNWGNVAPYYIEQESPQLAGAPRAGRLAVTLPNNHLQYAVTWFGLAAALAAVYFVWLRGRLRRQ